jgi:hypothetical protein
LCTTCASSRCSAFVITALAGTSASAKAAVHSANVRSRTRGAISSKNRFDTAVGSGCERKSSILSSRPAATNARLICRPVVGDTTIHPSAACNTFGDRSIRSTRSSVRPGCWWPVNRSGASKYANASSIARSTTHPRSVAPRCTSAASADWATNDALTLSATYVGTSAGVSPFESANPTRACISPSNAGSAAIGPVWPYPDTRTHTSRGNRVRTDSASSPNSSATPGRQFVIRMSAESSSVRSSAIPPSVVRSRATLRLLRLPARKITPPSSSCGPKRRYGSPRGGSTLITSAPRSASIKPA